MCFVLIASNGRWMEVTVLSSRNLRSRSLLYFSLPRVPTSTLMLLCGRRCYGKAYSVMRVRGLASDQSVSIGRSSRLCPLGDVRCLVLLARCGSRRCYYGKSYSVVRVQARVVWIGVRAERVYWTLVQVMSTWWRQVFGTPGTMRSLSYLIIYRSPSISSPSLYQFALPSATAFRI